MHIANRTCFQFTLISNGYSWSNVSDVCHQYWSVLRSLPVHPGAGVTPLRHATHILQYLQSRAARQDDRLHSAVSLLNIYDHLLSQADAFLDEQASVIMDNAIILMSHWKYNKRL